MSSLAELRQQVQQKRDALKKCEGKIDQSEPQRRAQDIDPENLSDLIARLEKELQHDEQRLQQLTREIESLLGTDC